MEIVWRFLNPRGAIVAGAVLFCAIGQSRASANEPEIPGSGGFLFNFPTVASRHKHARALLENAMAYVAPTNGMIDPKSGYPFEGWNQDPKQGLFLRSFTQLTAIGQYMELLAEVAAGQADTPYLSREQALAGLARLVASLREDQRDPRLSAKGLLVNFLDLATGKRLGPLASDLDKPKVLETFGPEKGEAIWNALQAKGWIAPRNKGTEAAIERRADFGANHFDGPLAPYRDEAVKQKIMGLLDQRVLMLVFGDNANLSASAAKTIGTLLRPEVKDKPEVVPLRGELERFLDDQREGYARLYDAKAGLFDFGWNATRNRLFGWEDLQGNWKTGHMDYLVNEFRGPTTFVALRFGLPAEAIRNLGFKMKPYRTQDGRDVYVLAPWEGSAFQALGFGLSLGELKRPGWRRLLENMVEVEVDFATREKLPGFLSESYTGEGVQYTGAVGIPAITVSPRPRITDAASLYTLGAAYSIAPEPVERFLMANEPAIAKLLTNHGPWEGFNTTKQDAIRFQTSAHTLALVLGLIGTGSDNMARYLDSKGLSARLDEFFPAGERFDLLSDETQVFAWTAKEDVLRSTREPTAFHVQSDRARRFGIAFVAKGPKGIDLSGGTLTVRYRSAEPMGPALVALKPADQSAPSADLIAIEITTRFAATNGREAEIRVPLPATPGLARIKEVVITYEQAGKSIPVDFSITGLTIGKE